ncbi:hypothetical protein KAR91_73585 [Candidatus Pacearchaeota archaeon]|nr:hypothetical protein [Candidatus Pacearchaeota archaeon]
MTFFQSFTLPSVGDLAFSVKVYALVVSVVGVILSTKKLGRIWKTRHLRKVWGIKNGEYVIVVCSELDDAFSRQHIEPKEFIYNLKYGDVDAYFEVIITLLRLYPNIKLRIMSAGEAENTRIDLAQHLILIGGPDYNTLTEKILKKNISIYDYKSPDVALQSNNHPEEIVIYDKISGNEYCELEDEKDYGYLEKVKNPNNPDSQILLFGGCHTIGVTGAVKAFSMADSEHGEIPKIVLKNAKIIAKRIKKGSDFAVILSAERVGQTINTPIIDIGKVTLGNN